uniref:Tumor necrosis factor n=1 Tax=Xenopus tropicalis TaxID=8364 RepID=A0A803JH61_XENTR
MNTVESQMENGLLIVRHERSNRDSTWRCVSICAFLLLLGSTILFALLHFQIIPNFANKDESKMPEILAIKTYLGAKENDKLVWNKYDPDSSIAEKMLKDNSIVIPENGLYFVYTQVSFTGPDCQRDPLHLTHTVNIKPESYPKNDPILTSMKTVCEVRSGSAWFQSIYEGGIFNLEKGSVISTETEHTELLDDDKESKIYLGILAV